jgi:hypothetical protein
MENPGSTLFVLRITSSGDIIGDFMPDGGGPPLLTGSLRYSGAHSRDADADRLRVTINVGEPTSFRLHHQRCSRNNSLHRITASCRDSVTSESLAACDKLET